MNPLYKLAEKFGDLPGIGPRQAMRFVYFLLTKNSEYRRELAKLIQELDHEIAVCTSCFRYHTKHSENNTLCKTCASNRDQSKLMVVARDTDYESIEKTKLFDGYYFVLGGTIPVLDEKPEETVRLTQLKNRLQTSPITELIIAMNANPEGENTEDVVRVYLKDVIDQKHITVTRLGRGLSTGVELEYSDSDTLKNALLGRK